MPIGTGGAPPLVLDLLVILATASAVALLLQRLRMAAIPGFLIAGAIVGPSSLGFVADVESIDRISSLAIVLLMFTIGLQLETHALRDAMVPILGAGIVSTAASVGLLWPAGLALGLSAPAALALALALAMSSTAVVLQMLQQRRELKRLHARLCMGIAIAQDLLVVGALAVIPPLAAWSGGSVAGIVGEVGAEEGELHGARELALSGLVGLGGIACLIAGGHALLPRILLRIGAWATPELILIVSAAMALGAAFATAGLGFSPEMGAFIAGFLLAGTPFKHQLVGQLAPLRDLLMAVFFTSVGLRIDPAAVAGEWAVVLIGVGVLMAIKAATIAASSWGFGASARVSINAGFHLAQAGEFSLVILAAAFERGIFTPDRSGLAIGIIGVSLVLTPAVAELGRRMGKRLEGVRSAPWITRSALREPEGAGVGAPAGSEAAARAIVAGFGPVGRVLVEQLSAAGLRCTIVDLNPRTVVNQRRLGREVILGDISNREVLEAAGVRDAAAVLVTIPDEDAALRACQLARSMSPGAFIGARISVLSRGLAARTLGADHVTVEEIATAEAMARQVMEGLRARGVAIP